MIGLIKLPCYDGTGNFAPRRSRYYCYVLNTARGLAAWKLRALVRFHLIHLIQMCTGKDIAMISLSHSYMTGAVLSS